MSNLERIGNYEFERRYEEIDKNNLQYDVSKQYFDVSMSLHSFIYEDPFLKVARRLVIHGNMDYGGKLGPSHLTRDERIDDAKKNMDRFLKDGKVDPKDVRIMRNNPDRNDPKLYVVNIDEQEVGDNHIVKDVGDFVYTYNPDIVLAIQPADCPTMIASGENPKGRIYMMAHYGWQGSANDFVGQTSSVWDSLDIERSSLSIYLTPGAQAESFHYHNYPVDPRKKFTHVDTSELFVNVRNTGENPDKPWEFSIDTPFFVYHQILKLHDIKPSQIFCDTNNTSSAESGYSSNTRSINNSEDNTRDLVIAKLY